MHINNKYIVVTFLFLFIFFSCEKKEESNVSVQLSLKYVFVPFITDMVGSSPIKLPNGINYEATIINSEQELIDYLPSDIIESDVSYNDINYTKNSLLSLKFRSFYKPNKIEYRIFKESDGKIIIKQMINVSDSIRIEGYFFMSNLIIDRLSKNNKIYLEQSLFFE